MTRLLNKVAIVTGAAGGQGAAEARLFAKEGAYVVATDLQEELLKQTVADINQEFGDRVVAVKHNVANEDDWNNVVKVAIEKFGKIDVLVNNAGIGGEAGFARIDEIETKDWEKFMAVNSTSQFLGIRAVTPEMKKSGGGSIINISSIAGLIGGQAGIHYTASKGAVRLLTKQAAIELAPHNIRVNSVHPGGVKTPMLEVLTENEELLKQTLTIIPLKRIADPEEIAKPVLFLASDDSSYITGTELVVDGGVTAQ